MREDGERSCGAYSPLARSVSGRPNSRAFTYELCMLPATDSDTGTSLAWTDDPDDDLMVASTQVL